MKPFGSSTTTVNSHYNEAVGQTAGFGKCSDNQSIKPAMYFDHANRYRPVMNGCRSANAYHCAAFWRRDLKLSAGYFLAAVIALLFSRFENGLAMSWFATAVLTPRLALTRPVHWRRPIVLCGLASMIASALVGAGPAAAPIFGAASMLEAACGAILLRRYMSDGRFFDTVTRVGIFMSIVGVVAPALSGFIGAAAAKFVMGLPYPTAWLGWLMAHGLGALTYMPIITLLMRPNTRSRLSEIKRGWCRTDWFLSVLTLGISLLVFGQTTLPILFLVMLPLTLTTMRHGRLGASASITIIATAGGILTLAGSGPVALIDSSPAEKVLFFQFFLATCIVIALPMAAELNRRRFLARRLQESEARFRLMADRSSDVLFNLSLDGIVHYVSPSIVSVSAYSPAELIGKRSIELVHEEDRAAVRQGHRNAVADADQTFVFEYRGITKDGRIIWFETHTRAMCDETGQVAGVVSSVRDVSHRKALESRLSDAATRDPLTGLFNRIVFDERLKDALRLCSDPEKNCCLVIADIDHFKQVNDQFGHPCGDAVLREVAGVFNGALRSSDTLCRIGGEEFGLILSDISFEDGYALCERIRERLAGTMIVTSSASVRVTVSMGLADLAKHPSVDAAVSAADIALYDAKNRGRNRLAIAA